jgi:hypothetical protein
MHNADGCSADAVCPSTIAQDKLATKVKQRLESWLHKKEKAKQPCC